MTKTEKLEIEKAHLEIKLRTFQGYITKAEKRLGEINKELRETLVITRPKSKDVIMMDRARVRF